MSSNLPPSRKPASDKPRDQVRVTPTRPQAAPRRGAPAPPPAGNSLLPLLLGGGLALLVVAVIAFIALNPPPPPGPAAVPTIAGAPAPVAELTVGTGSTAIVETTKGTFKIKLYTEDQDIQQTVNNFRNKAASGVFNGRTFHRVEDWVIQGGDPLGTGTGGEDDLPGEYSTTRSFVRGGVGMASKGAKGQFVNDSQWFVVKNDSPHLNGSYSIFGQVTEGMEVVDQIAIGDKMTKVTMAP